MLDSAGYQRAIMTYLFLTIWMQCFVTNGQALSYKSITMGVLKKQLNQLLFRMANDNHSKLWSTSEAKVALKEFGYFGKRYQDCHELFNDNYIEDGVYELWLAHEYRYVSVFCDMQTVGVLSGKKGWITIQRRVNGKVNFNKRWKDYVDGFGFLNEEHWIGLNNMYQLLRQKMIGKHDNSNKFKYEMRIEMEDWDGVSAFSEASGVTLEPKKDDFEITLFRNITYSKGLADPLSMMASTRFSTYDHNNNDHLRDDCLRQQGGGWWQRNHIYCGDANLNGLYSTKPERMTREQIFVTYWTYMNRNVTSLRYASIKIQ